MKNIPAAEAGVPAVSSTDFEKMLMRIESEKAAAEVEKRNRELENERAKLDLKRHRDLVRSIASVFHVLKNVLGMPYRDLSLEEFETMEIKLREMAIQKSKRWLTRLLNFFWNAFQMELLLTTQLFSVSRHTVWLLEMPAYLDDRWYYYANKF